MRVPACGIALVLAAVGLFRGEGVFFAAAFPFAAYAALGLLRDAPALDLQATRRLSARLQPAGTQVGITLTVVNRGPRIEALALRDIVPEGIRIVDGRTLWRGSLDPQGEATVTYRVECPRGAHTFDGLTATAEDPFTGVAVSAPLPCPAVLMGHPGRSAIPAALFEAGAARSFSGRSRARREGGGTDFSGTRDYAPGDPLKRLNWRAEALWGRPIVNVFEESRAIDAGVILDCRCEAYDRPALFEAAVSAALSLGEGLIHQGHRVAFLRYGSLIAWVPSGTGRDQKLRLRIAAARAQLGAHAAFERFDNLPIRIFPPRSLVLVVSPVRREDIPPLRSLRALGYEVAVLRPDPLSFETAASPETRPARLARRLVALESEVLLTRLLRSGITVLDWKPTGPLSMARTLGGSRA